MGRAAEAGIFLAIDGEPVDLAELSWYEKAPCGCTSGVRLAYLDGKYGYAITTAAQAMEHAYETQQERLKYHDLGFTCYPERTSKVKELLEIDCPHTPKWGVPERPKVDGHQWAAVHALGAHPRLMHLVPDVAVENAAERRYGSGDGVALCGSKAFHWKTEWYALDGKVECKRCWKKAAS